MDRKKIPVYGLLIALAMIFSYLESLLPLFVAIPGVKLGLPNLVIIFAVYRLGFRDGCRISLIRVLLMGILFGNLFSFAYSVAGAVCSLAVMKLLMKTGRFGTVGVSAAGGVAHNFGQIGVAVLMTGTPQIAYYLPVLCLTGTGAGVCIGILSALIIKKTEHIL